MRVCEHVCAVPMEARKGIDPLERELQVLVSTWCGC